MRWRRIKCNGYFHPFIKETKTKLVGVEAGGSGVKSGKHAAPLSDGKVGVLHGMKTYLMQDKNGQILSTHSVSAGLDYQELVQNMLI